MQKARNSQSSQAATSFVRKMWLRDLARLHFKRCWPPVLALPAPTPLLCSTETMTNYERIANYEVTLKLRDQRRRRQRIAAALFTIFVAAAGIAGCAAVSV